MPIRILPVTPWRPDEPPLTDQCATAKNCVHRIGGSFGPVADFTAYATALTAKCQGAFAAADTSGNVDIFAGTSTNLYEMPPGVTAFSSASKSAAAYNVPADEFWRFATIGSRVVAANINDPMQSFVLGSSTKFADITGPKARYVAGVKNWLFAANTFDVTSGDAPWRVWWSAFNDATNWPTPGTAAAAAVQSDYNDIVGEGGWVTGIVGNLGTADAAVFYEHAVWRAFYVGPPAVFNFYPAEGVRGCRAPLSITQLGALVFYLGEDGFYSFDGTSSTPIGAGKVDKTVLADLDANYLFRVCGAVDPINKIVMWSYPGSGHSGGNPNHILFFNWVTGEWTIADIVTEFLFRTVGQGYTLDGLDSISGSIDALPYSLDSRQYTGGAPSMGAFNSSHVFGTFAGSNMSPTVDISEVEMAPGRRTFIRNVRPLCDGGTPTVALGTRDLLTNPIVFNNGTAMNSLGFCPQRTTGRYITHRMTLPAASSFNHIRGVEVDFDDAGVR